MPTALPAASEWTASTVTEGQFKTAQNNLRAYLAELLGEDGTILTALATLGAFGAGTSTLAGATTVVASHRGRVLLCSGTWTLSLTAAATLGNGFAVGVVNTGSGTITIDPASTEQIDGATTLALGPGESALVVGTGTAWRTLGRGGTAKVSSNDAAAGYLNGKLVAGTAVALTENNNGGNESLSISVPAAASAIQSGANVGSAGFGVLNGQAGTQLQYRNITVNNIALASHEISVSLSGNNIVITHDAGFSGACFLPGTLVSMADGTWRAIEDVTEGDLLAAGPFGRARVLGVHRPLLGARWLWDLGPVRITGDHLVYTAALRWGCVEPAVYAKLREAEFVEIETAGGRRRIRAGAVPSIEIDRLTGVAPLYCGVTVTPRRVRESDPDQPLIGLWTDLGAYVVQGGIVVDGFPQW